MNQSINQPISHLLRLVVEFIEAINWRDQLLRLSVNMICWNSCWFLSVEISWWEYMSNSIRISVEISFISWSQQIMSIADLSRLSQQIIISTVEFNRCSYQLISTDTIHSCFNRQSQQISSTADFASWFEQRILTADLNGWLINWVIDWLNDWLIDCLFEIDHSGPLVRPVRTSSSTGSLCFLYVPNLSVHWWENPVD